MKNIIFENNTVTFETDNGEITSPIDYIEVVDEYTYHLGTIYGIFLINVNEYSINNITFTDSQDAVFYLNS